MKHLNQIMMVNIKFNFWIIVMLSLFILPACKPDKLEIEVYTSDIQSVNEGEVIEVPLKVEFSIIGEDKNNDELTFAVSELEDSEFEQVDKNRYKFIYEPSFQTVTAYEQSGVVKTVTFSLTDSVFKQIHGREVFL